MKMPNPIAIRFAKLIFSILSITVLGVIFAMISHDHTVSGQRVYIDKGKFLSWLDAQTQMEKRDHYGW